MSMFKVNLSAINPKDEQRQTPFIKALVDTGSELTWMPKQMLLDTGITLRGKKRFTTASGQVVERDFGYAILSAEGYCTNVEVAGVHAKFRTMWDGMLNGGEGEKIRRLLGYQENLLHAFLCELSWYNRCSFHPRERVGINVEMR